jgi:molecular chaperone DnaK (HSP70)
LITEASAASKRDHELKEVIATRNRLNSLTRNAQRVYREIGPALSPEERHEVQKVLDECALADNSEDIEQMQRLLVEVERVAALLTSTMLNSPDVTDVGGNAPPPQGGKEAGTSPVIERF